MCMLESLDHYRRFILKNDNNCKDSLDLQFQSTIRLGHILKVELAILNCRLENCSARGMLDGTALLALSIVIRT